MNEKFFDLKKEKQDRMINAALKVFAMNGYGHASTDEIVREAGISKGLLFHYFISKLGLYAFVYDYSVRYLLLELTTGVNREETDFFKLVDQIKLSQVQCMKNYPYILQYLNRSRGEDATEALMETEDKRGILPDKYCEIMEKADLSCFREGVDVERLKKIITYTADGLMTEQFMEESFQPEIYYQEIKSYLDMLKKITCK